MYMICRLTYFVLLSFLFSFIFPFQLCTNFRDSLSCNSVQFPCYIMFLMLLSPQMLHPIIGPFIFRVLDTFILQLNLVRLYALGSYSLRGSSGISLKMHRVVIHLFCKVVALYLDNSMVEANLCNQGDMVSLFLSRLDCCILNLAGKHGITLILAYIPTHLMWRLIIYLWVKLVPEWHLLHLIAQGAFHIWH